MVLLVDVRHVFVMHGLDRFRHVLNQNNVYESQEQAGSCMQVCVSCRWGGLTLACLSASLSPTSGSIV